ncbi:unnamed protein product [Allacma fusca]|uniref:Mab-21-like HhH/H2TH-like domain-containing protein n=1 Tax=Allacma fusca TaxID=39272 RepID=A0A8J2MBZ4_9HEXA|nr:unnamed protein product [Allacma fusca]
MGLCHSEFADSVIEDSRESPPPFPVTDNGNDDDEELVGNRKNTKELYSYIDKFQDQNYERLLKTFQSDKQLFILNQLLMCIQFFQNFEKSLILAKDFKRIKEHEINEKLAKLVPEGVIEGDRRVVLMHGMGEILAQNFIYRPQADSKGKENVYEAFESLYKKKAKTETFTCEGILPLDFFMNYDNFEVYTRRQFLDLQENDYSISPSDSPIFRICMMEPDRENKLPRGYVSLLMENSSTCPVSIRTRNTSGSYTSAVDTLDVLSEGKSYTSSYYSEEEDTLSTINMQPGEKLLHRLSKKMNPPDPSPHLQIPSTSAKREESSTPHDVINNLKFEGFLPKNYPSPDKKTLTGLSLAGIDESENPKIQINGPQLTPLRIEQSHSRADVKNNLFFPNETTSSSLDRPGFLRTPSTRKPQPIPTHGPDLPPRSQLQSPTGSFTMFGGRIPALTVTASTDIYKQYQELQDLSLIPRRQKLIIGLGNPSISPEYLINEKVEKEDDKFGDESSSDSDDSSNSNQGPPSVESDDFVIRTYLNSSQFSSVSFSDFSLIGTKIGINSTVLQNAQVLHTTIRCSVNYKLPKEDERDYNLLYTFTPSLHSKSWPQSTLMHFRHRLLRTKYFQDGPRSEPVLRPEELSWPSRIQIESIEGLGCGIIPECSHSSKTRPEEPKEWRLIFPQGESLLLNTLKHVHWRAYIFMALLFRAFVFPMGPSGVGLEHIRNLIYQMCEQDYIFWNEEESGAHLRAILDRLYECLGNRRMPNFFIPTCDMFKRAQPESTRVQALLSNIRENLIIYSIYALRNLTCLQKKENVFPIPNLKRLYNLITYPDTELLYIINPNLRRLSGAPEPQLNDTNNNKKKKKNKKKSQLQSSLIQSPEQMETHFQSLLQSKSEEMDGHRKKLKHKYDKYLQKISELEEVARKKQEALEDTTVIPVKERRKSIDLDKFPVTKVKNLRVVLIIEFFIQHFLKMAEKAITFRAFSEATMYTLHVENLCKLLSGMRLVGTNMGPTRINEFKVHCEDLRRQLGPKMAEYVRSKLSHLDLPDGTSALFLTPGAASAPEPKTSNFTFASRQLPTPPPPASSHGGSMRKFDGDFGITLPSPTNEDGFLASNFEPEIHNEFELPQEDSLKPQRRQSVAFGAVSIVTSKQPSPANRRNSLFGEPIMIGAADIY